MSLTENDKEILRKKVEELRKKHKDDRVIITEDGKVKKPEQLNKEEQMHEFVRCAKSPRYFIETYLTIFDQTRGEEGEIVPFKLFPDQKDLINIYQKERWTIANKYRQAGISTTTSAYLAWYMLFKKNRKVAIVANKLETAVTEMMKDVCDFIASCPDYIRLEPSEKDNEKHKIYSNGNEIRAFSSKGLRGFTPTLLFWDETAWTERSDTFWTATKPTLQTGGACIMVSTPNGLDPVFYKTFINAKNRGGDGTFYAKELWWYNDPRYTRDENDKHDLEWVKNKDKESEIRIKDENWSREKRAQMVEDGWEATSSWLENEIKSVNGDMKKINQEILCSFLGSGSNFVDEEYLKRIEENEIQTPIRQEWEDKNMWIFEDAIEGEDYIMPIDVAGGTGEDYSCIQIYKVAEVIVDTIEKKNGKFIKKKKRRRKLEMVAEYYAHVNPQQLGEIAYFYGKQYNNALSIIDITGGYGVGTLNKMLDNGYENVHYSSVTHKALRDQLSGWVKTVEKEVAPNQFAKVDMIPGFVIGQNRGMVLQEMERAVRMEDVIIKSVRLLSELKTFVTVSGNRVADHRRSFHDDAIMSLAIGCYVASYHLDNLKNSLEKTKSMINSMIKVNASQEVIKDQEGKMRTVQKNPYGKHSWLFGGLTK
jgi:hypothetical protein